MELIEVIEEMLYGIKEIYHIDEQGRKQGEYVQVFPNGVILTRSTYKDGKPVGEYIGHHESGQIRLKGWRNENGKRDGRFLMYHENGQIFRDEYYSNGLKHGKQYKYYINGDLEEFSEWKNGRKIGPTVIGFYIDNKHLTALRK